MNLKASNDKDRKTLDADLARESGEGSADVEPQSSQGPVGLRSAAQMTPEPEAPSAWREEDFSRSEVKWRAGGQVTASVDGAERFTMALGYDGWTQIQGLAHERARAEAGGSSLGLIDSKHYLGVALTMMDAWANEMSVTQRAERETELQRLKAAGHGSPAMDMELGVLRLVRTAAELWGASTYSPAGRVKAKAFLQDATLLHRSTSPTQEQSWYVKPNGSLWAERDELLESPYNRYSLRNVDPLRTPEAVPDSIRKLAVDHLLRGQLKGEAIPSTTWTGLPGGVFVERSNVITTPFWVYRAYELTEAPSATHSTITTMPDGRWVGKVGTRQLPPALAAMPYGDRRIEAVNAWHKEQHQESHRLIRQAFPEASFGKIRDAEIEIVLDPEETPRHH